MKHCIMHGYGQQRERKGPFFATASQPFKGGSPAVAVFQNALSRLSPRGNPEEFQCCSSVELSITETSHQDATRFYL